MTDKPPLKVTIHQVPEPLKEPLRTSVTLRSEPRQPSVAETSRKMAAQMESTAGSVRQPATYERDYVAWTTEQASLLRTGRASGADLANIAEEIEDLGKSRRDKLVSHVTTVDERNCNKSNEVLFRVSPT